MPTAVAACYRAQFLNVTLPGGVLGDVARGVGHGRGVDDVGRGLRAVAWERAAGQVVLAVSAVAVLAVARPFPPTRLAVPGWVAAADAAAPRRRAAGPCTGGAGAGPGGWRASSGATARALLSPDGIPGDRRRVARSSSGGHVATFVVAARAVGVRVAGR